MKKVVLWFGGAFLALVMALCCAGAMASLSEDPAKKTIRPIAGKATPMVIPSGESAPSVTTSSASPSASQPAPSSSLSSLQVRAAARAERAKARKAREEARAARSKAQAKRTAARAKKAKASVYYPNCAAVRAAGKAPIHRGEPGYARKLDRDGDGIACDN